MALPDKVDYLIIGAGIHGLSTAWHLAEKLKAKGKGDGSKILVVDKDSIAAGASGVACGVVRNNYYQPGEFSEGRQKMAWMPVSAKLIYNPSSGAPGFNVENVYCLPGVPSILKSMIGGLTNELVGGDPIISHTLSLRTVESEIAKSLSNVQDNNKDVDIGSYPFFKAGKLGVSIVLRSPEQKKIDKCNSEILKFVKEKNIELVENS